MKLTIQVLKSEPVQLHNAWPNVVFSEVNFRVQFAMVEPRRSLLGWFLSLLPSHPGAPAAFPVSDLGVSLVLEPSFQICLGFTKSSWWTTPSMGEVGIHSRLHKWVPEKTSEMFQFVWLSLKCLCALSLLLQFCNLICNNGVQWIYLSCALWSKCCQGKGGLLKWSIFSL